MTDDLEDKVGKLTDYECIFHKIKKDELANRIHSLYSNLIEHVCKNCDGYNLNCPEYRASKSGGRELDLYRSYNFRGKSIEEMGYKKDNLDDGYYTPDLFDDEDDSDELE